MFLQNDLAAASNLFPTTPSNQHLQENATARPNPMGYIEDSPMLELPEDHLHNPVKVGELQTEVRTKENVSIHVLNRLGHILYIIIIYSLKH